jgi:hypothetical protein
MHRHRPMFMKELDARIDQWFGASN